MDHVTLWMPALVTHIPVDLHKLLEDSASTADTLCCEPSRIMKMTVDVTLVFVVRVLGAKKGRTDGTREMLYMEFLACGRD